jgi:hypothetical protein
MARQPNTASVLTCECSPEEREALDEMKRLASVGSDANLVRIALWSLADHLGVEMPDGVFDLRLGQGGWWARNPKLKQDAACPPVPLPAPRPRPKPRRPAPTHPWRGPKGLVS